MKTEIVFFSIMACSMPTDKGKFITIPLFPSFLSVLLPVSTQANVRLLENAVKVFPEASGRPSA